MKWMFKLNHYITESDEKWVIFTTKVKKDDYNQKNSIWSASLIDCLSKYNKTELSFKKVIFRLEHIETGVESSQMFYLESDLKLSFNKFLCTCEYIDGQIGRFKNPVNPIATQEWIDYTPLTYNTSVSYKTQTSTTGYYTVYAMD